MRGRGGVRLAFALGMLAWGCGGPGDPPDPAAAEVESAAVDPPLQPYAAELLRALPERFEHRASLALPPGFEVPDASDGYLSASAGAMRVSARPMVELGAGAPRDPDGFARGFGAAGVAWLMRPTSGGIEDFVRIQRPRRASAGDNDSGERAVVSYEVRLDGVAGLRLVSNVLEFLDSLGAPRLRMRAPYVVDANGARWPVDVSLEGCRADTRAQAPWRRPVTAPGSDVCQVRLEFDTAAAYPVWMDPEWSTTGALAVPRTRMARSHIPGALLAVGGLDAAGQPLATVERFDPASLTWAMTGALESPRVDGELLEDAAGNWLLLGGGTASTERYSSADGSWMPGPESQRANSCAVRTAGAVPRLIQVGVDADRMEVEYLSADGMAWLSVDAGATPPARFRASCGALGDRIVLVGGEDATGEPRLSTWLLNLEGASEANGVLEGARWEAGPTIDASFPFGVTEPVVAQNLVVGGEVDGQPTSHVLSLTEIGGAWSALRGPDLPVAVSHATAAVDSENNVLLFGGRLGDGSPSTAVWSIFAANPVDGWKALPALPTARQDAHIEALPEDAFLVAGGAATGSATSASEVYRTAPMQCTTDAQCPGGACVEGRCCESACDGVCEACVAVRTGRPDGECAPVIAGFDSAGACPTDSEDACGLDGTCDGSGQCRLAQPDTRCGGECRGDGIRADHCDGSGQCVVGEVETCGHLRRRRVPGGVSERQRLHRRLPLRVLGSVLEGPTGNPQL